MKAKISILLAVFGLAVSPALRAADEHKEGDKTEHAHEHAKKEAGPNGGRIVTATEPHFEFFVTPERKVKITFLGEDGKGVALKDQSVTAIGGDRAKPTKLAFAKDGESLLSDKALPEGNEMPIVLMVKVDKEAKTVTEKFNVNLAKCPTCEHAEYACTCEHAADDHEGHDHKH